MGLYNQQINPIKAANKDIKRIRAENRIACSLRIEKGARRRIKAASRVPIPATETGIRVIRPAVVTVIAR